MDSSTHDISNETISQSGDAARADGNNAKAKPSQNVLVQSTWSKRMQPIIILQVIRRKFQIRMFDFYHDFLME